MKLIWGGSACTCASNNCCFVQTFIQPSFDNCIKIVRWTIESVIDIDKETEALRINIHGRNTSVCIHCPFVHSIVRCAIININISISCNKKSIRSYQTSRNCVCRINTIVEPYLNSTISPISHIDRIVRIDKNTVWFYANRTAIGKSCCVGIPWCIWTKFRLIIRKSYNEENKCEWECPILFIYGKTLVILLY